MEKSIYHIFRSSSEDTDIMNELFFHFFIAAFIVFLLVAAFLIFIVRKYKTKTLEKDHFTIQENRLTERLTLFLASVLVIVFLFLTVKVIFKIQKTPTEDQKPFVKITGHQWWWEIEYLGDTLFTANELHIPTGDKFVALMESADVVHDWYVPALGRKIDMVPGVTNFVWIQARDPGVYEGMCNEFCGAQHTWMRVEVFAHEPKEFDKWFQAQKEDAVEKPDSLFQKGKQLFQDKVCANCHTIRGTTAKAKVGPDLTHFASRNKMLGGKAEVNYENIQNWIKDPQKMKHGAYMPNFLMTEEEINALAHYLYNLK
ncbi:cytochrome c oxidase subunit II [Aureivirga marina]|uniref:cytochrome c oxidase subunit II n=1 Tax=Aureivirga marina TaxID=1182451 RepID=UPI0018C9EE05|nr:cytochrome c oxidase subunit II [Aureivirga marina]